MYDHILRLPTIETFYSLYIELIRINQWAKSWDTSINYNKAGLTGKNIL